MNNGNGVKVSTQQKGEEVVNLYNSLDDDEKQEVLKKILDDRITVVFGGNNVICNSTAFQINGASDEIGKALESVPPEAIGELLKAIGEYVARHKG